MSTAPVTAAQSKFFGRKFQLTVTLPEDGSGNQQVLYIPQNALDPEAFRVKFQVYTVFYQKAWFADIDIYNLDKFTTNQLISGAGQTTGATATSPTATIKQGMVATLYAGYQNGAYGAIWTGPVFQCRFTKEQVVDFKITLHCLLWLDPLTRTNINSTFSALTNQTDLITQIANLAFGSGVQVSVSPNIKTTQQSRGGVVFGSAKRLFNNLADDNNFQWFLGPRGFNFARVDDNISDNSGNDNIPTAAGVRTYSPPPPAGYPAPTADGVIIGTPEQTQYGVRFRVLMDPAVQVKYPAQLVKINNSQIIQLKKSLGEYVNVLDPTGTYIVLAAAYVGDTRGDQWYTEIEGLTSVGGKWAAAQALAERASTNH